MRQILSIAFFFLIGFGQVGIDYAHNHNDGVKSDHQAIHASETFCSVCVYHLQLGSYQTDETVLISTPVFVEIQNSFHTISPFIISSLPLDGRAPPVA